MRPARFLAAMALLLAMALPASAQTTEPTPPPAAAQAGKTGPLSGYMDFHFNKVSGEDGVIDFHRFVLLFTHSFTPRIRFVGELELEHDGKRWLIILAPPSRMDRRGLPAADLSVGKPVKVEGYPSRVHDGEMRAERITVDGRVIELR